MRLVLQGHYDLVVLTVSLPLAERADLKHSQHRCTYKRLITWADGWPLSSVESISHMHQVVLSTVNICSFIFQSQVNKTETRKCMKKKQIKIYSMMSTSDRQLLDPSSKLLTCVEINLVNFGGGSGINYKAHQCKWFPEMSKSMWREELSSEWTAAVMMPSFYKEVWGSQVVLALTPEGVCLSLSLASWGNVSISWPCLLRECVYHFCCYYSLLTLNYSSLGIFNMNRKQETLEIPRPPPPDWVFLSIQLHLPSPVRFPAMKQWVHYGRVSPFCQFWLIEPCPVGLKYETQSTPTRCMLTDDAALYPQTWTFQEHIMFPPPFSFCVLRSCCAVLRSRSTSSCQSNRKKNFLFPGVAWKGSQMPQPVIVRKTRGYQLWKDQSSCCTQNDLVL